jgi:hypothetical protein
MSGSVIIQQFGLRLRLFANSSLEKPNDRKTEKVELGDIRAD